MSDLPQPGEDWIDLRPMTDRPEWRDSNKFRRVVTVTAFEPDGFAEGLSGWEKKSRHGIWVRLDYPARRKTRIRAIEFLRRFIRGEQQ